MEQNITIGGVYRIACTYGCAVCPDNGSAQQGIVRTNTEVRVRVRNNRTSRRYFWCEQYPLSTHNCEHIYLVHKSDLLPRYSQRVRTWKKCIRKVLDLLGLK